MIEQTTAMMPVQRTPSSSTFASEARKDIDWPAPPMMPPSPIVPGT